NDAIAESYSRVLVSYGEENRIELTVVGVDEARDARIVGLFVKQGLRVFGPSKRVARIESSKIYAKELMRKQRIPTAQAGTFERNDDALQFCDQLGFPIVIKADGLALGKGVIIAPDLESARSAIDEMMNQGRFGEAGRR